jgi:hypothetical protein
MLSKQEVFSNYGGLLLGHRTEEDTVHRFVFTGIADDGAEVKVYHSPSISVWEDHIRPDRPVCLNEALDYRRVEVRRGGTLEFEEWQAYVF